VKEETYVARVLGYARFARFTKTPTIKLATPSSGERYEVVFYLAGREAMSYSANTAELRTILEDFEPGGVFPGTTIRGNDFHGIDIFIYRPRSIVWSGLYLWDPQILRDREIATRRKVFSSLGMLC
jgi:hypothetical protein